jgi:Flp pilus assembly protein TadG
MSKTKGLWRRLRAFTRATSANVAMMFGLSLLPLAMAAGAGLDYAQAMMVHANMMDALDASALAVGSQINDTTVDPNKLAQDVFNANYKGPGSPVVTPQINGQSVSVSASAAVSTTLLALVGMPNINVSASSLVVWGQTKLWVSLVLDNTGSMTQTDSTGLSKIAALKDASHQLLAKLQTAAASGNPGDVQVAIIPFAKDVNVMTQNNGTSNLSAAWIDWSDWEGPVQATSNTRLPTSTDGPGTNCPWSSGCLAGPGSTSSVSKIPSSGTYTGYICPDAMSSADPGMAGHYYNGCYTSVPQSTLVTVTTVASPMKDQFACKTISNVNNGAASCPESANFPKSNGSANTTTTTNTIAGYSGNSTSSTGPTTSNSNTNNGSQSCSTRSGVTTCTWTRTVTYTSTAVTTVKTAANFAHTWVALNHSYWGGCVMDRNQNDDVNDATPGNKFPAENSQSCAVATVMTLNYIWDSTTDPSPGKNQNLSAKIDSMVANGGTNQTVGLVHGMQAQMTGDPYNAPVLPGNTTRYIILLSDGLNTMDRWYGDGTNQSTQVDTREGLACTNAKNQGFIIYTLFVDLNGTQGNSAALKSCATDSSKYYDLTQSSQIVTAFNQIADQITNLRVSH